jgi:Ferritin-like domain
MPNHLINELVTASPNRRSFLKKIGAATAAVGALSIAGARSAEAQSSTEVEILKFALNLEYLEAEFYTYATFGKSITSFGIAINGEANGSNPTAGGTTVGGSQVTFSNNAFFSSDIAAEIGVDERAHVVLLRSALGSAAIAKPNLNLNALGFGFGSQDDFLRLSRIFEDIGVSAYGGAAGSLTTPAIITTAARILAAEAEHVSAVRTQIALLNITTSAVDHADLIPPPSGKTTQFFSLNTKNGLSAIRTPGQVLNLAYGGVADVFKGGFFPDGVNGSITKSLDPAVLADLN